MGKGGRKKKRSTGLDALFDSTKPESEWKGGEWHAGVSAMALDDVGGGSAAAAAAATAPARTGEADHGCILICLNYLFTSLQHAHMSGRAGGALLHSGVSWHQLASLFAVPPRCNRSNGHC